MAGLATGIQQLEHRLGTTVIVATLELEHSHVLANQMGNGNQNFQIVNVRNENYVNRDNTLILVMFSIGPECNKLVSPENGKVTYSSRSIGSYAQYSCNDGYYLVGVTSRKCEVSGWTDKAPICKRKYNLKV